MPPHSDTSAPPLLVHRHQFLARPRRFGKTLLVNMLETWFQELPPDHYTNPGGLAADLDGMPVGWASPPWLWKGLEAEDLHGSHDWHPVIRLDLSRASVPPTTPGRHPQCPAGLFVAGGGAVETSAGKLDIVRPFRSFPRRQRDRGTGARAAYLHPYVWAAPTASGTNSTPTLDDTHPGEPLPPAHRPCRPTGTHHGPVMTLSTPYPKGALQLARCVVIFLHHLP